MTVINYKSYQQVLDLASESKRTSKASKITAGAPKKRTKSGCLTCRRRKKKCDEEKVGGKCQACIRNFLDCCWPGEVAAEQPETETLEAESCVKIEKVEIKSKGASAYPSPVLSPQAEAVDDCKDIKPLELGTTFKNTSSKVTKPKVTKPRKARKGQAQFIVTSFDHDRALCQVKV